MNFFVNYKDLLNFVLSNTFNFMNKQKNECTNHGIKLCPDAKFIVKEKLAKKKYQSNISAIVNEIILEYGIIKDHEVK